MRLFLLVIQLQKLDYSEVPHVDFTRTSKPLKTFRYEIHSKRIGLHSPSYIWTVGEMPPSNALTLQAQAHVVQSI